MEIIDLQTHVGKFGEWDCSLEALLAGMHGFGVSQAIVSTLSANEFDDVPNKLPTEKDQFGINGDLLRAVKASAGYRPRKFANAILMKSSRSYWNSGGGTWEDEAVKKELAEHHAGKGG